MQGAAFSTQDTSWGVKKVQANWVWVGGGYGYPPTRGEGAFVTVLDTGLDSIHLATGDGPARVGPENCLYHVLAADSCYDTVTNPDARGHGVHVAGIIAARDNAFGYIGVASGVDTLESVRVCNDAGYCDPEWTQGGLDRAIGLRFYRQRQIVNISVGVCKDLLTLRQSVAWADTVGILVIAAAGNTKLGGNTCPEYPPPLGPTAVMYPAAYSGAMAVSGTLENDGFALAEDPDWKPADCYDEGSRYGSQVQIAAPFWAHSLHVGGEYRLRCGTSFAAAVVTGVAALVWGRFPSMTASEVRQRLRDTAVQLGSPTYFGSGRVNALNAVYGYETPPQPPPPATATISGPGEVQQFSTCLYTATTTLPDGPYTWEWFVNDVSTGWYESYYYHTESGTAPFTLRVTAQNSQAQQAHGELGVTVSASAAECLDQ